MAILFDSGDGDGVDYLDNNSPTITDFPVTFSCWVKPDSASDWDGCMTLGKSGSVYHFISLSLHSGGKVRALTRAAGGTKYSASASSYSAGTWQHIAGVFRNSASRIVYLNGIAGTEETSVSQPVGINRFIMGEWAGRTSRPFDGSLAECTMWNTTLSSGDISALADGFSPLLVQPNNIVSYYPLVRDYSDTLGNNEVTPNNSINWSEHPAIFEGAPTTHRSAWGGWGGG